MLVLLVTAASVQDTTGGRDVVDQLAARHPGVVKAWADSGYKRSVIERGAAHGIDIEVVSKDPGQKGFAPLPKRWAIERTFGWWMLHRRLARDYETLPERSATMIHWAMIPVDCTILCRSVPEFIVFGGCLTRVLKKVFAVS